MLAGQNRELFEGIGIVAEKTMKIHSALDAGGVVKTATVPSLDPF